MLCAVVVGGEAAAAPRLDLSGRHPFRVGDDRAWAAPDLDDSKWHRIRMPGEWSAQGISSPTGYGWYRIHFQIPPALRGHELAVNLGHIGSADETYLNGERIGGEGTMGELVVEAYSIERVYRLPRRLLRLRGDNVLAVRVQHVEFDAEGIVRGTPHIGVFQTVLAERTRRQFQRHVTEAIIFGMFALILFFATVLLRDRQARNVYLWAFLASYLIFFVTEMLAVYQAGWKTPLVQRANWCLLALTPALFYGFSSNTLQLPRPRIARALVAHAAAVAVLLLIFRDRTVISLLTYLWLVGLFAVVALLIIDAIRVVRRGLADNMPLILSTLVLGGATLWGIFAPVDWVYFFQVDIVQLGMVQFVIVAAYLLAMRLLRTDRRARAASEALLDAHEAERQRVARELHDGMGQSLAALKLDLQTQRMDSDDPAVRERLEASVAQVQELVEEMRGLALDLHPAAMSDRTLPEAMGHYAAEVESRPGRAVRARAGAGALPGQPPPRRTCSGCSRRRSTTPCATGTPPRSGSSSSAAETTSSCVSRTMDRASTPTTHARRPGSALHGRARRAARRALRGDLPAGGGHHRAH